MFGNAADINPPTVTQVMDAVGPRSTKILSSMLPFEDKKELLSWSIEDRTAFTNSDERRRRASLTLQRNNFLAKSLANQALAKQNALQQRQVAAKEFENRAKERLKAYNRFNDEARKSQKGSKAYFAKTVGLKQMPSTNSNPGTPAGSRNTTPAMRRAGAIAEGPAGAPAAETASESESESPEMRRVPAGSESPA